MKPIFPNAYAILNYEYLGKKYTNLFIFIIKFIKKCNKKNYLWSALVHRGLLKIYKSKNFVGKIKLPFITRNSQQ